MSNDADTRHPTEITKLGDTEVRIERLFDAPRELVWDAYTDPELLCRWLGPRRLEMTVQEFDLRPGGRYRYTHQETQPDSDGPYVFFGEFREVDPPRLLVQSFDFEGNEHGSSVDRVELEQLGPERTRLLVTAAFTSPRARDAMLEAGMERGVREGYEKLDKLLVQLGQEA
jgi:uncharacterized protein YndB with AHSA1/START domain